MRPEQDLRSSGRAVERSSGSLGSARDGQTLRDSEKFLWPVLLASSMWLLSFSQLFGSNLVVESTFRVQTICKVDTNGPRKITIFAASIVTSRVPR